MKTCAEILKRSFVGLAALFILAGGCGLPCMAEDEETLSGPVFSKGLDGLKISALWYLSFQDGTASGNDYSKFTIKRGYINISKTIFTWGGTTLEGRITPDTHQDDSGDVKVRLKYAYGKFKFENISWQPWVEFGLVHMPWLDFDEHVNIYRMQDTLFIERIETFNSADFGVTFGGFLGPKLKDWKYHYPGKYGSFAVGVYNGGGYHAKDLNQNKVIEGRLSLRPLPDVLPGLQFSYFGILGKGNTAAEPDWTVNTGMASYEFKHAVLTATYYSGEGDQKGTAVDESGKALPRAGYSFFGEAKLPQNISFIARYDYFDPDENVDRDENERFITGLAWNMGNHNTWLFDYDRAFYRDDREADDRVQVTLQIDY